MPRWVDRQHSAPTLPDADSLCGRTPTQGCISSAHTPDPRQSPRSAVTRPTRHGPGPDRQAAAPTAGRPLGEAHAAGGTRPWVPAFQEGALGGPWSRGSLGGTVSHWPRGAPAPCRPGAPDSAPVFPASGPSPPAHRTRLPFALPRVRLRSRRNASPLTRVSPVRSDGARPAPGKPTQAGRGGLRAPTEQSARACSLPRDQRCCGGAPAPRGPQGAPVPEPAGRSPKSLPATWRGRPVGGGRGPQ